ncbi:MAG: TatD family hydrolase [Pseudomonadota bacterium]|nr:TatD family hydrolase [Pseudomonadota bacterium]
MLIDSHCHIDAPEFDADRAVVIAAAHASGVHGLLVPAVDRASWERIALLADADANIYPAYGLHPMFLDQHADADTEALAQWVTTHRCSAIGECGLDHYVPGLDPAHQLRVLRPQLELARELDLPVILHARRALEPLLAEIRRVGRLRGIVHSFAGSSEQAQQWCAQGFLLGFGGPVTYERAARLRRVVTTLPLEYLLLETDAPDQPLHGHQGQRNTPERLVDVLNCVAALRSIEPSALAAATSRNLMALIGVQNAA